MIRRVPVPARRLLTLREDHPAWRDPSWLAAELDLVGVLMRINPPPHVSDEKVAEVASRAEAAGAVRVKVVARTPAPDVVQRIDVDPLRVKVGHRETILEVAAEARSSNPATLRAILERVMDEEGV